MSANCDIVRLMAQAFGCKDRAALCMLSHGQVSIDGYTVGIPHRRRWNMDQLSGRMLKAGHQSARIGGGRTTAQLEQLRIDSRLSGV